MKAWQTNLEMLEIVAGGLGEMANQVCFIGGATTVLYLDPSQVASVRPTEDVDCVVELGSYLDYHGLEKKLEKMGFEHSVKPGGPLCRWIYQKIKVDIMPSEKDVIGFSNRWYSSGIRFAEERILPSGKQIKIFSIPYFFASKLDAFRDRGRSDYYGSKDLEDIVTLLDGIENLRQEFSNAPLEVQNYLKEQFHQLLGEEGFLESLSGHLSHHSDFKGRTRRILDVLKNI